MNGNAIAQLALRRMLGGGDEAVARRLQQIWLPDLQENASQEEG